MAYFAVKRKISLVAEGIETAEQLQFLRERHCDIAQGFYLARPLSSSAVSELLHARAQSAASIQDVREAS